MSYLPLARSRCSALVTMALALTATATFAAPSYGAEILLRIEPAAGHPLAAPQTDQFGPGGGGALKAGITVIPILDLQAHGAYYAFAGKKSDTVGIGAVGGGPRLQRPRTSGGVSPWVDANLGYVQTGPLDRAAFDVGGGAAFPVGDDNQYWAGPFVRYMQLLQPDRTGIDGGDARLLFVGMTLEVGVTGSKAAPPPAKAAPPPDSDGDGVLDTEDRCPRVAGPAQNQGCPETDSDGDGLVDREDKCPNESGPRYNGGCPIADADGDGVADKEDLCPKDPGPKESKGCPDTDGDGVADNVDACPAVPGDPENRGCPRYKQVVVKFDEKLEIGQKIFFAFDKATILPKSFDLLDEVAQALKDAPSIKVRIEGHTDAVGNPKHNDELSEARSLAVRDYLIDKGVEGKRLDARGYGAQQPLDSNATTDGREKNRRVEFVILKPKH